MGDPAHYYDILELEPGANADELKQAYRDLAQVWHPDRFANSPRLQRKAQEKMKEINEAYEFLKSYQPPRQAPASNAYRAPQTPRPADARTATRPDPTSSYSSAPKSDELWCLRGHTALVSSVAFSPSSKLIISGSYDKTVRIWQTGTGLEKLWFLGHTGAVTSVAFGSDSRAALSGSMDKTIFLRDSETKKEMQYFYAGAVVECVAISFDNRYVASGTVGSGTQLWDAASGRELRRFGAGGFVSSVTFSPRGERVAVGTSDGEVTVYDRMDGKVLASIRVMRAGTGQMVESIQFSKDGAYLLTSSPQQLQIWQTGTGRESGRLETGVSGVTDADLSPDGAYVVTGHSDGTVRLWSLSLGREAHVYKGHTEGIKSVAYASNGGMLASGSFDKTIRVWRVHS